MSCLFFWAPYYSAGQTASDISLIRKKVKTTPDSKEKIDLLIGYSQSLRKAAPDLAMNYARGAVTLSELYNHNRGNAYSNLGLIRLYEGKYTEAVNSLKTALNFKSGDENRLSRAKDYDKIAYSYAKLDKYDLAIENYQKVLWLNSKLGKKAEMAAAHNEIGEMYFQQRNYRKAIASFEKSLGLVTALKNKQAIATVEKNIRLCQSALQNKDGMEGLKIEALEYQQQYELIKDSLEIAQKEIAEATSQIAEATSQIKEREATISTLEEAQKVLEQEKVRKQNELEQQKLLNYYLIAGAVGTALILLLILLLIYRGYKIKKNANRQLGKKNIQIQLEKKKSEELLLNILPAKVAQELKAKGGVTPQKFSMATLLFTDFRGFTSLAETMPPEELVRELNRCFEAFDHICEKHNIEKIKTIGDAYMAAGGIPVANRTNPKDVVNAALEMQAFMWKWKAEKERQGKPFWELRIGIHTGPVITGVIGKNKFAYDVWGDTVNVASRMEQAGEAWKINISSSTYDRIKDEFVCINRGLISIKHKGPVDMYFVQHKIS